MIALRDLGGLVAFKATQRLRHSYDEILGWELREKREAAWGRAWGGGQVAMADWLRRSGGGRFWLSVSGARRWAARECSEEDVACARAIVAGRFDLLGSDGDIGSPPRWRRDLYSGREWPLQASGRMRLLRNDGSDIRTVWELSRCYHFPLLAKAYWRTGDPRFLEVFRDHVESWLAQNPPGRGPHWLSPMDSGIRAANWIVAAFLFGEAPGLSRDFWGQLLANLRLTGWFVERHLEWHPVARGNHFVANAVGLVYLGALFADDREGRRWLATGARLLQAEMAFQVRPDGVSFEAALAYHRLVTEFFAFGGTICRRNGIELGTSFWSGLDRMYAFLACYLPESGDAPMLGDADDGRLHMLCAAALAHPRRHRLGLPGRFWPKRRPTSGAFPEGGFYVIRGGKGHAIIRCGPIGLNGAGCHDHNDQLSLELVIGGVRLVADSGTFAYTRNLEDRFAFRATAAHSITQLGGEEQNPIAVDRPWRVLADRTRSQCVEWTAASDRARFVGRHFGYRHRASAAVCWRTVDADLRNDTWSIEDRVEGTGGEVVTWRLHFVPGDVQLREQAPGDWTVLHSATPFVTLRVRGPAALTARLGTSRMSERYGRSVNRPVLLLEGEVELPIGIHLEISAVPRTSSPAPDS